MGSGTQVPEPPPAASRNVHSETSGIGNTAVAWAKWLLYGKTGSRINTLAITVNVYPTDIKD